MVNSFTPVDGVLVETCSGVVGLMALTADDVPEAVTWLTLGHAYEAATDKADAVAAFRRAQSLAAEGTRTKKEASAALARLH